VAAARSPAVTDAVTIVPADDGVRPAADRAI
jgi:hypothetical protein